MSRQHSLIVAPETFPDRPYLNYAENIGDELLRQAHTLADGSLTWGRDLDRQNQQISDSGPFCGRSGEAMLLASLYRAGGRQEFRNKSLLALRGIVQGLDRGAFKPVVDRLNLGLVGLGGMIYALIYVARLLQDETLLSAADRLAEFLTPRRIADDSTADLLQGSAGALLSQLALAEAIGSLSSQAADSALVRAGHCANRLLALRTQDSETGLKVWPTLRGAHWTGFSHGAAGIALALLRYFSHTGDELCYRAVLDAFAFERSLFRSEFGNWLQTRRPSDAVPRFWSWCHGAPGIVLSRLKCLQSLRPEDQGPVGQDLLIALQATAKIQRVNIDTLCCGYFGRIDILLEAGRQLGNPSLVRQAQRLADLCLERVDEKGFELGEADGRKPTVRGFWQGLPGIAYSLLRLQSPDSFPCLLSFD